MSGRLLITGFEPFGGDNVNPSWEAVKALPGQIGDFILQKMQIPVEFGKASCLIWEAAQTFQPQVILCVGQAGGRCAITPEMVGINLRNGTDNVGVSYLDSPIGDGPTAYFSTLPVRAMADAVQKADIPAAVSFTAGSYVCNDTLYSLLHLCAGTDIRVGFIHIPYLPHQAKGGAASLPLAVMVQALEAAIGAIEL